MDRKESIKLSKYKKLIEDLKARPEVIMHTETPIVNSDMLKLIELTKTKSKSEAIQFAINFTVNNIEGVSSLSPLEQKLEKLRYGAKEVHESSNDILDSDLANKHYQGKYTC